MCVVRRKVFQMSVALKILELWDVGNGDVCLSDFQFCLYLETLKRKLKMTNKEGQTVKVYVLVTWLPHHPGDAPHQLPRGRPTNGILSSSMTKAIKSHLG